MVTTLALVLASVFLLVAAAAALVLVVSRRLQTAASASQAQAVQVAVRQILAERGATAAAVTADREQVVAAVVNQAVQVTGATLDARLANGSKELSLRTKAFEDKVQEIGSRLDKVTQLVGDLQKDKVAQHRELVTELRQTAERSKEVHQITAQLKEVLASPKARGQWGERMAEDVLRSAGFVEGVSYRKQTAMAGGNIPDFTFLLPGDLELNMDVKFPIDNYIRFLEATDDAARDRFRRQFAKDVKARVREIADRAYIDPERTVDTVLLFIPNEAVYAFLHENDAGLLDQALSNKVVLCSPLTLFSVLAIIRQSVDNFRLERRSNEILDCLVAFRKEWGRFCEQVEKVGKNLVTVQNSFDEMQGTRRNVMERQLRRVDDLERARIDLPEPAELPDGVDAAALLSPVGVEGQAVRSLVREEDGLADRGSPLRALRRSS